MYGFFGNFKYLKIFFLVDEIFDLFKICDKYLLNELYLFKSNVKMGFTNEEKLDILKQYSKFYRNIRRAVKKWNSQKDYLNH